jgi:hypothetical protein
MRKKVAIEFFGGVNLAAEALGISGVAVTAWPDRLSNGIAARVIVAGIQIYGVAKTRETFPRFFERRTLAA